MSSQNPVSAPTTYTNPVVIVIPGSSNQDDVTIYYVLADSSSPVNIVDPKTGGLIDSAITVEAKMHVRGDATRLMPKKQYAIKLKNEPDGGNFLGMPGSGKEWVFNDCGMVDFTLIRNVLTFNLQSSMGQYAPAYKYFELFYCDSSASVSDMQTILSNYYSGLYLNFDKICFQASRINLPYDKKNITIDYAIIQLNQSESKYLQLPKIPLTAGVQIYEPKLGEMSQEIQTAFTNWFFNSTATTGWGQNFASIYGNGTKPQNIDWTPIRETTDYQSFAVYFILNELAKDPDGYHKSTFMVKNQSVVQAGPFWDKNKSYGNIANYPDWPLYTDTKGWLCQIPGQVPCWWPVLLWDPKFCEHVWGVWYLYQWVNGLLSPTSMQAFISAQVDYITNSGALARNNTRWPNAFNDSTSAYDAQVSQLNTYLAGRVQWIGENLSALLNEQSGFTPGSL